MDLNALTRIRPEILDKMARSHRDVLTEIQRKVVAELAAAAAVIAESQYIIEVSLATLERQAAELMASDFGQKAELRDWARFPAQGGIPPPRSQRRCRCM